MGKVLSIDVGERRVGLATSDDLRIIASPYGFINREGAAQQISDLVVTEGVSQIVVGMPYLANGSLGSQAEDVQKFVQELQAKTRIPIDFENEMLSSAEAASRLKGMQRKIREKGEVDAMAATIILEGYMNRSKS